MSDSQQLGMDLPDTREVERVDEFKFEPIKGYPMLNWRGKRPFTSTRYYPAQLKEVHGEEVDGWMNKIYWGDNLQVMSHLLKEFRGKVQLVYIDPPFDSKADYKKRIKIKGSKIRNDTNSFEEKQYSDIWTNDEYLQFTYERVILIKELLRDDGSIYLHCDYKKSHHLRCILDEVFGSENIKNEIVWTYHRFGIDKQSYYTRAHDSVLWYAKSEQTKFNLDDVRIEYSKKTISNFQGGLGGSGFGSGELNEKGKIPEDYWNIAPAYKSTREVLPYPTQKPEALLSRVIKGSSDPGDLVLDCFMGSGTVQAVAMKLGRRFIGADINLGAIQITSKRLLGVAEEIKEHPKQTEISTNRKKLVNYYTGFEVYNVNYYDVFRNPVQAKELLIEALEINPLSKGSLFDGEKDGRMWKIMPINRIATKADLSELIAGLDLKAFEKRQRENPRSPVEYITLVCMGHDPDLKATLQAEVKPYEIDVEVVDILRDRQDIQFKRDSEAEITVDNGELIVQQFFPMNLLGKLSLQQENVEDWREMVESIMIDWNYDGAVLEPATVDIPDKKELVKGRYSVPEDAGTIRVKITDLLSESLEMEVQRG